MMKKLKRNKNLKIIKNVHSTHKINSNHTSLMLMLLEIPHLEKYQTIDCELTSNYGSNLCDSFRVNFLPTKSYVLVG